MKKLYFTIIILMLIVQSSTAQFYTQYFDGADTAAWNSILYEINQDSSNVWQVGPPQKIIFDSAATQPNAMVTDTINYYPANDTSRFIAKVTQGFGPGGGIFALQWKQKLDMDADFDGGIIEYTIDSGNSWINVFNNPFVYNFYGFDPANADTLAGGEYAFSGTDSTWKDVWLCFDMNWLQQFGWNDTLFFRFTLISDSVDNSKEGWMIDNMMAHITFVHTIKETEQDSYLNVYPNPANGVVHIQAEKRMDYHIIEKMELMDPLGRLVKTWANIPTKFWFNTDQFDDGVYYLKVKTNFRTETIPLVICK